MSTIVRPGYVKWNEFVDTFPWNQGEHITLIGPTGCGKTTLALHLLHRRKYLCVFAAKPKDPLITALGSRGYKVVRTGLTSPEVYPQQILWPPIESPSDIPVQRETFRNALASIYRQGGWSLYIDELRYITQYLKLESLVDLLWQQGRSHNISIISGAQRPAWIPLSAYDQASHLFIWRFRQIADLRRISSLGTIDPMEVVHTVKNLERHECVYIHTRTGEMVKTRVGG